MIYVDTNFTPLDDYAKKHITNFRRHLFQKRNEGEILICYRGEEEKNIKKRLVEFRYRPNLSRVYDNLYHIGDKSRHYFMDRFNNEDRDYLTTIEDCSKETFEYIFDRVQNAVNDKKLFSRARQKCSKKFILYFTNPESKRDFTSMVKKHNLKRLIALRDYYLFFLHVAGSPGIRKESMLISTSLKTDTANFFSYLRYEKSEDESKKGKIVFHYFIPRPFEYYAIAPWTIPSVHDFIIAQDLPTYNPAGLFPDQQEIAIKGALFPQFILGVHKPDTDQFVVNPYLSSTQPNDFDMVTKFGFDVDQSDFENRLKISNFLRSVETDSMNNFSETEKQ